MREVKIAVATGLALVAVGIGVALARSPMTVARINGTPEREERIAYTTHGVTYCQAGESLPAGTTAIRLWLLAYAGPRMHIAVYARERAITRGERESGWTSREVTVPVKPLAHPVANATVCVSFALHDEAITAFGRSTSAAIAAREGTHPLAGRIWIEYLHPGTRSWASLAPSILTHMGLGRAASGSGIVLLACALLVVVIALTSRLLLRELP